MRRKTRQISVGKVKIGGNAKVSVQSMTKTDTRDVKATVAQIKKLEKSRCEIVRVAVKDEDAATCIKDIKSQISIPLIADIHFDYKLALKSIEQGADGIRINPGNIGGSEKVKEIIRACREKGISIRVGVNSGSIEKKILEKYGKPSAEAMVESALKHLEIFEEEDFYDIKVSLKASDVLRTINAYRLFAKKADKLSSGKNGGYPLHLGVTEAGTVFTGVIKSSIGIGILLNEGIGDTIRVSLTGDPVDEVRAGYAILRSLELREEGLDLISCPTCGRCQIDVEKIAEEVEERLSHIKAPLRVAVMGCIVNGPGEAKDAHVGIAGGTGEGLLFKEGKIIKKLEEKDLVDAIVDEVEKLIDEKK